MRIDNCRCILDGGYTPIYKTLGAACADLAVPERVLIPPRTVVKIDLKISFEIPEGYKIIMYPRSSLLIKKSLMQPVSIIDSDYTGHVHVPLYNLSDDAVALEKGERVAQIECVPAYDCIAWNHEISERDQNGFGGTGTI